MIRANRADAIKIEVWIANESRELIRANRPDSRCESPVPLRFCLFLTSFLPLFNLRSAGNLEPRFGNHGLQTLGGCSGPIV